MARETSVGPKPLLLNFSSAQLTQSSFPPVQSSHSVTIQVSSRAGEMDDIATQRLTKFSNESIPSSLSPLTSFKCTPSTSLAVITQQMTPLEENMALQPSCSPESIYLARYDSSWSTPQPLPLPPSYNSEEREPTPEQQPKSLMTLVSLLQLQKTDVQKQPVKMISSIKPSTGTTSEPCRCFDAPLPAPTPQTALALPRPYCPGLVPCPSPLHPHCLTRERLKLWTPSHNHSRVIHSTRGDKSHVITEEQLNCILEVLGTSWAEKMKEAYGAGLLAYHVFCNTHDIAEHQCTPIRANTLLVFLSSCAGSYSGSALTNFTARLRAWHLLHGLPWQINAEELQAILEGASCLAPPSSKRPLQEPFHVDSLELIHSLLDPSSHKDAAIFACLTVVFYCVTHLGEFMVQLIKQFHPAKHITRAHVSHHHDLNGLPVTKFHIPWTKTSPTGEDMQCAPLGGVTDPIRALERHLRMNPADPEAHLFAWLHPTSGLRPLSRSEVVKHISSLVATHNLPNFKGHSLRIGGTLHYLLCGTPFNIVKTIGRWAGDSFTIYL
ncbi:hypothetical protein PISMIDRAFT_12425 [Pisolithus microcarpus 441]|uniref:Tyr recombinase domain-containing protein n=1 Tax=Pisolithus microcarpus 441 TaxID=765257 RepID=A0A0C9Y901_9AGAM|nr:hypothetical protein BKA83DRAFT_12425 [Pisolithus microcarpus]KIK21160.1 hypothetical protein PISMIDRAFT_12425 [Pisolithus microcarpus 441]